MNKTILFLCISLLSSVMCRAEKIGSTPSKLVMKGGIGMQIDVENVERNVPFNVFADWIGNESYSGDDFFGTLAVALIDENEEIKEILHQEQDILLSPGWGYGQGYRFCGLTVSTEIDYGDIIRFVTRENGASQWLPVESRECEITYCYARDNEVYISDVNVKVIGTADIPVERYCDGTYYGPARQEKAIYSSVYCIDIQWPEGKDHRFLKVEPGLNRIQIDPDRILIQLVEEPEYNITLMACSDDELVTEQLHFTVSSPGSLPKQLRNHEKLLYINNISVSGVLNESDILFMRDEMPMLEHIDLSGAEIQGGLFPNRAFDSKGIKTLILPPNIWGLGTNALCGTKLFKLDIPASVDYYGLNALNYSEDLTLLVLRNPEVIPVSWCVLEGTNRSKGVLFVPKGSKEAFAADIEWGQFGQIVEGDNTDDWLSESDGTYSYTGMYPDVTITKVDDPKEIMRVPETVEFHGRTFNVTALGDQIFSSSEIKEIYIPKTIIKMGEYAINSLCYSLTDIHVAEENPVYFSHEGVLYERPSQTLLTYPSCKGDNEYVVPEGVRKIGGWACYNFSLEKITFPASLEEIGSCSFCWSGLKYQDNPVIVCKAVNPPSISTEAFDSRTYLDAEVYVPASSLEAYRTHNNWKNFSHILPMEDTGIDEIDTEAPVITVNGNTLCVKSGYPVEIYGMDGRLLYNTRAESFSLPAGLYIVKINGKATKIRI